jgi:SAM-dependent methyltransferase
VRTWLLDYLVCPECGSDLSCSAEASSGDDVEAGTLTCRSGGHVYPIVRGIPRMAQAAVEAEKERTADAFGWQWLEFDDFHRDPATYDAQFLDWVAPLAPPFFSGKTVLDAGCGMGRFSAAVAHLGAERVIGVDLSESVESARQFTRNLPNVALVQADIYRLPFKAPFDFAFSIGVIHHLPDPEAGVRELARHVKPGGTLSVWVYGYENNGWIRNIVNPIREKVTARLPRRVLYGLSLLLALVLQPVLRLLYAAPEGSGRSRSLPYYPYLHWLAQFGLRHNHVVIFDHLVAPTAFYVKREELQEWFERAGFSDVSLSWRNQNSWRGHGRRPLAPELQQAG